MECREICNKIVILLLPLWGASARTAVRFCIGLCRYTSLHVTRDLFAQRPRHVHNIGMRTSHGRMSFHVEFSVKLYAQVCLVIANSHVFLVIIGEALGIPHGQVSKDNCTCVLGNMMIKCDVNVACTMFLAITSFWMVSKELEFSRLPSCVSCLSRGIPVHVTVLGNGKHVDELVMSTNFAPKADCNCTA